MHSPTCEQKSEGETGFAGQGKAERRVDGGRGGGRSIMADPINAQLGGEYDLC